MGLTPCPTCSRHLRVDENACPFCGAKAPIGGFAAIAAAAALALAGCGGKTKAPDPGPGNEGDDVAAPDAGVDQPPPPDDPIDRGGDVQPLYGVDMK
jgi:hypothetical protein